MSRVSDSIFGIFNAGFERRAALMYDFISTNNTLGESSLYLNVGYWDGATRYDGRSPAKSLDALDPFLLLLVVKMPLRKETD